MKPLLFLTYKSVFNGIRRAITSPKRITSLIIIVAYYFWIFIRPSMASGRQPGMDKLAQHFGQFSMPLVDAALFGLFAAMSLLLAFGIFTTKGGFKPADVDVLFPTPISPKMVLGFRIVREYLGTLLFPLFMVLIMFPATKAGWTGLFGHAKSGDSQLAMRSMSIAWILMALCWVAIAYAAGMFVNRSDLKSDRNKKIIGWSMGIVVAATVGFLYYRFSQVQSADDAVAIAQHPFLRLVFFTATAATHMATAPLTGHWGDGLLGAGMMIGIIAAAIWAAMTQAGWMYDQAAVKGFGQLEARKRRAQGDMVGEAVTRAQSGRKKQYRKRWIHRLRANGVWALIWKEVFIQARSAGSLMIIMLLPGIIFTIMPIFLMREESSKSGSIIFMLFQTMVILMVTMNTAMSGFIEVLRRVDLQKPLPFSPFANVYSEVVSKAVGGMIVSAVSCVVAIVATPSWWASVLAVVFFNPGLSIVMSAAIFLVTVLFPDEDDATQRQFHRMVMLLAVVIAAAPGFGIAGGLFLVPALRELPFIPALIGGAVHLGIATVLVLLASQLYASYNPSE